MPFDTSTNQRLFAVLEENRLLRLELDAERAKKHAMRERLIARRALSERTLVVSERELPHYVPYTLRQIQALRKAGKLIYLRDPLRKNSINYNLRDVEATLLSGRPCDGPLVRQVDWDSVRVSA